MPRYILRFRGAGPKPAEDVARIAAKEGVRIVDETSRMLLAEVPDEAVDHLKAEFPDWAATPEESVDLPDPRYKIADGSGTGETSDSGRPAEHESMGAPGSTSNPAQERPLTPS